MKLIRILPLMLPIILTACVNATSESTNTTIPDSPSVTEPVTSEPRESRNTADTKNDSTNAGSEYTGVCGEVLKPENFEEGPDSDLLFYRTDYGYTSLFDGKTYNSYDDPEKFDLDLWECTESCEPSSGGLFIVNKGDSIGGLTCTDAFAEYFVNTKYSTQDPFGLMSSGVCFEGELEVTGYIDRLDGNEGYADEGELYFYPDGESWQGLPVPYNTHYYQMYSLNDERLIYAPFRLSLGVVYDYSALGLESDIPQGSTAHMKLVLKDIELIYRNSDFGGYAISTATIVSAEKID